MKKNKWLYLSGIIAVVLVAVFIINKDKFIKTEAEKQQEVIAAIQKKDIIKLKEYIDKNYSLNFVSKEGYTPLELALNQRSLSIATLLLKNDADINPKATTPLYVQMMFMLDNYFQIGESSDYPNIMNAHIKLLHVANDIQAGDIQATDEYGNTALHRAAALGHPKMIKALIELGAKPTATNKQHETPLMLAVKEGQMEAIHVLYTYYDQKFDQDDEGNTLLYSAAMNGHEETVRLLLKKSKEEINRKNDAGKTALMIAAEYGYPEIVKQLLQAEADPALKSKEGKTALVYAKKWKHKEIISLLN